MRHRVVSLFLVFGFAVLAEGQGNPQDESRPKSNEYFQGKKGKGPKFNLDPKFLRSNPKFVQSFREVVSKPSQSTVRILCDGKDTALGMIVGADGWILTKANDLHGDVACRLRDGREFSAEIVGIHKEHDLAMLKLEATGLSPVVFTPSKEVDAGSWVACAGLNDDPVAIGVVSVGTRTVINKGSTFMPDPTKAGYLGIVLDPGNGGVSVKSVEPKTPAEKAGLKENDLIVSLGAKAIADVDTFREEIARHKPKDVITLRIMRGQTPMVLEATLGSWPNSNMPSRSDKQNKMGSELSNRRTGYASILQHDSVVKPADCGGPIVDLDGRVIGINICRAGRTESWAVPSEVVLEVMADLKSGKLAPPATADAGSAAEKKRVAFNDEKTKSIDLLLSLMKRRLEVSVDVARYKFANKLPIADEDREKTQLERLLQLADNIGLDKNLTREFLTAQFAASRALQENLHAAWSKGDKAPATTDIPDLKETLRPRIDVLSSDLVQAFAKVQPYLRDNADQQLLRQHAASIIQGDALTDGVRTRALAGWVAPK